MRDVTLAEDEVLVSFDVSSLFTNVPTGEAVKVIQAKLREDDDLAGRTPLPSDRVAELLDMCLRSTYFSYGGEFYEQREGATMGSPVSAVVANLYMEFFEELALESAPYRPRLWKWYVDDTCCILRKVDVDGLLHHLNSIRSTIKFIMEMEEGGSLPFLDTRIMRKADGKLHITVYCKQTHTDRYVYFRSHHPIHVKRGMVRCLYDCTRCHCTAGTEPGGGGGEPPHESFHGERLSLLLHPFRLCETTRRLETRLKEHNDICIKGFTDKSAIAEHAWTEDHPICWDDTKMLQHASRTLELVVKEAICIQTTPESLHFNRNGGCNIPDCWIATYSKLGGGTHAGCTHLTTS